MRADRKPITSEQRAEAKRLMDAEGPIKGMMRVAYRCDICEQIFMHRFIPYGLGRGHRFSLCMCQLTANNMHNTTRVLEMRDHENQNE
ncbi:hypothetical protein [Pseudomonas aeruginosa]|uniref:hypothetical protein n=1 Tax=Pseudomonas aeruginosa TaxID=287 RepID=UPI002358D4CE|nr:hypothetical protein KK229_07255 [Pseudomonas aeruginosa]